MAKKQIEVVETVEEVVNETPIVETPTVVDDKYPGHNTRAFRQ